MRETYHGSCHCKAVKFEADIDLDDGTGKCNCTFCWKRRAWNSGRLQPREFRLVSGEDALADYSKSSDWGESHHYFCRMCGIATHSQALIAATDENFLSIYLPALDDLDVESLISAPQHYMDGLHDDWASLPTETRHL